MKISGGYCYTIRLVDRIDGDGAAFAETAKTSPAPTAASSEQLEL
jgi:hypothetical protein